ADRVVERVVLGVVRAGDPRRPAAVLVRLAAPRLGAGLPGRRNRVGLPHLVTAVGVERDDRAAHAVLGTRRPGDDLAVQGERHRREALGLGVVAYLLAPHQLARRFIYVIDV